MFKWHLSLLAAMLVVCGGWVAATNSAKPESTKSAPAMESEGHIREAIFAGGCFWCMEPPYDKLEGVISSTSGYIGGDKKTANYKKVSGGGTGHYEAVKIVYDSTKVDYQKLLDVFWVNVDPLDDKGQFCDKGTQYLSAIFYGNKQEKAMAKKSKAALDQSKKLPAKVVTEILPLETFYPAEDYHQDYYVKNPIRYKWYRGGCGRDARLKALWGNQD